MITGTLSRPSAILAVVAALAGASPAAVPKTVDPPPNAPATIEWNAGQGRLSLRYRGGVIFEATVGAEDATGKAVAGVEVKLEPAETRDDKEKVEQRLKFAPAEPQDGVKLVLRGTVTGSDEAFPAETDGEAQKRFPLVRTSVGLSHNLRNNAVYDRRWDWVLIGPGDGATRIQPQAAGQRSGSTSPGRAAAAAIELVFRPRFYQKHRGLAYFEPWTYRVWKGSVTGYCTWWAYRDGFSQEDAGRDRGRVCREEAPRLRLQVHPDRRRLSDRQRQLPAELADVERQVPGRRGVCAQEDPIRRHGRRHLGPSRPPAQRPARRRHRQAAPGLVRPEAGRRRCSRTTGSTFSTPRTRKPWTGWCARSTAN